MGTKVLLLFSILLLGTVSSPLAFADGNDSPDECKGSLTDNWADEESSNMYTVGEGNIDFICIKSGDNSFGGLQHSGVITENGFYGDGDAPNTCYEVEGLGSPKVTITETGADGCKDISHTDNTDNGAPPGKVGGSGHIIDNTSLLVTGATLNASWMIPLLVSAAGIGIFVVTYKKE